MKILERDGAKKQAARFSWQEARAICSNFTRGRGFAEETRWGKRDTQRNGHDYHQKG
jgi:hypothetical protein